MTRFAWLGNSLARLYTLVCRESSDDRLSGFGNVCIAVVGSVQMLRRRLVSGWHYSQCLSPRRDAFMLTARLLTTFCVTLVLAVFRDSTPVLAETIMCMGMSLIEVVRLADVEPLLTD